MSLDQLISASVRDLADEADVSMTATDIADAALRRRARQRTARLVTALAAVVAVAAAIVVPTFVTQNGLTAAGALSRRRPPRRPSPRRRRRSTSKWVKLPLSHAHTGNRSVSAHPSEGPPVHLIAADDVALSAYYTESGRSGSDIDLAGDLPLVAL